MNVEALKDPEGRPLEMLSTTGAKSLPALLDTVLRRGMVLLTRHKRPEMVVMSVEAYQSLLERRPDPLDMLAKEFDELYASMQTSKTREVFKGLQRQAPRLDPKVIFARKQNKPERG